MPADLASEIRQDPGLAPRRPLVIYGLQFNRAFTFGLALAVGEDPRAIPAGRPGYRAPLPVPVQLGRKE